MDSEWTSKKDEFMETEVSCQKLIQERERNQRELSKAVKLLTSSALQTMEDVEKVFTELICSLEKKRSAIKEQIRAQEKAEIDRAEELHTHLDQELTELRKRQSKVKQLLTTDDQVHCLKSRESMFVLPTFEGGITQHTHLFFKDISISMFKEVLEDACQQQTARILREVSNVYVTNPPEPKTHNDFLQYFCELHLDLNTAHNKLKLCDSVELLVQDRSQNSLQRNGGISSESVCGSVQLSNLFGWTERAGHSVVSVDSEWTSKKDELMEAEVSCQELIQERERGQRELSKAVKLLTSSALQTMWDFEEVFTELICSLEKKRSAIKEQIKAQERAERDRAEELHKHLDQELKELRGRQSKIKQLLTTNDPVHCLKSRESVCALPTFEGSITQHTHLFFRDISISLFKEALEDVFQQQTARIFREVSNVYVTNPPEPKTHNDFLQ
ncbi:hypothetical protein QQF64_025590, partial [Cirrhinus molitorella]